jgi:hypothetical protein
MDKIKLLSNGMTNAKTSKSELKTFILYLSPARQNSKQVNICPNASEGCEKACLFTAGRGAFDSVKNARIRKTEFLLSDRKGFYTQLAKEILNKVKYYKRRGEKIAFRLNGTSDLDHVKALKVFSGLNIADLKEDAIFYDYTKVIHRVQKYANHPNYHLTFSLDERKQSKMNAMISLSVGTSVAVVFNELPSVFLGAKVINGDKSDFRPNDPKGVIVGLVAKGQAKKDTSGFVQIIETLETV